jgi:hypothetical protein
MQQRDEIRGTRIKSYGVTKMRFRLRKSIS